MLAAFHGRLFGPGLPGAGIPAAGCWKNGALTLRANDMDQQVAAEALRIDAAGFNLQHMKLSWQSGDDEFAFFIEQDRDREQFLAGAPASLAPHVSGAGKQQKRMASRFRTVVFVYGLILALPILILAIALWNSDRIAGWAAEKIPVSYEERIGDLVLAQTRASTTLSEGGAAHDAVKSIGMRLTPGSRYAYRWFVAQGEDINAFAAPGGVIVVYEGLIRQTSRPEELAGVLAHEVAHVEQRHALRNLVKNAGFGVMLSVVLGDWSGTALNSWIARLTELKFSRDAEMDADREGLRRMVHAGIAPEHMANFFAGLALKESKAAEALSLVATHPASKERMETLREQIAMLPPRQYAELDIDWPAVKASLARKP